MGDFKLFKANGEESVRAFDEKIHEIRNEFDRDRDRILYSKAFRRLARRNCSSFFYGVRSKANNCKFNKRLLKCYLSLFILILIMSHPNLQHSHQE